MRSISRFYSVVAVAAFAIVPIAAQACALCVNALSELFFPPSLPWMVVALASYPVMAILASRSASLSASWFTLRYSAPAAIAGLLGGLVFFGPIPFLLLLGFTLWGLIRLSRARIEKSGVRTTARVFLGITATAMLVTAAWAFHAASQRTTFDRMVRWSGTGYTRMALDQLERDRDLATLRRLLALDDERLESADAAGVLARIGSVEIDGPLIVEALDQLDRHHPKSVWRTWYTEALAELLGGKPTTGDDAAAWRALLAEQQG